MSKIFDFTILVKKEDEEGYSGQCLEMPSAISQAETIEELKQNMQEAIELVLQDNLKRMEINMTIDEFKKRIEEKKIIKVSV
ncbi:type II toxin-antitoxin system HicB family antitoxin [Nitrosopumilus sp.]|uniref:type II toxin-antitoxin system HicB family antitoxin n=1 Tax=Nitrosopumilus sp. TaxID=2024843 RepID=UPI003B5A7763